MRIEDETYSIAKYLFDKFALTNYTERSQDAIIRPYFRIENFAHNIAYVGAKGFMDIGEWVIWYYGISHTDTMRKRDTILSDLLTAKKIDGYMEDFNFPIPLLQSVTAVGGTLSGNVNIAITGLIGSDESLISATGIIDVVDNAAKIQIPRIPLMKVKFASYNIYASLGVGVTPTLQSNVPHSVAKGVNQQATLLTVISGAAAPTVSELLFSRIFIESISATLLEDDIEAGNWDARIALSTQSPGLLSQTESWLMDDVDLLVDANGDEITSKIPIVIP